MEKEKEYCTVCDEELHDNGTVVDVGGMGCDGIHGKLCPLCLKALNEELEG